MKRLIALAAVAAGTALVTWSARRVLALPRRRRTGAHVRSLDAWENEGGNLAPHESGRRLQEQLG
jgi:hypothetical protein